MMEFTPICLECGYFQKGDKCPYFEVIPHKIKNREKECPHFSGGEHELFVIKPQKDEKK